MFLYQQIPHLHSIIFILKHEIFALFMNTFLKFTFYNIYIKTNRYNELY